METITTGKRLKALREDRGLSQSQLAKKADINSRGRLSRVNAKKV